jgi:hypothetical protein
VRTLLLCNYMYVGIGCFAGSARCIARVRARVRARVATECRGCQEGWVRGQIPQQPQEQIGTVCVQGCCAQKPPVFVHKIPADYIILHQNRKKLHFGGRL